MTCCWTVLIENVTAREFCDFIFFNKVPPNLNDSLFEKYGFGEHFLDLDLMIANPKRFFSEHYSKLPCRPELESFLNSNPETKFLFHIARVI